MIDVVFVDYLVFSKMFIGWLNKPSICRTLMAVHVLRWFRNVFRITEKSIG
jgi:hypothetical protein